MNQFWIVIFLIFFGQLLGSLIGIVKRPNERFLKYSLAFAAAMMIGISLVELIPEALSIASPEFVVVGFVLGVLSIVALNRLLPHIHPELCKTPGNMKRCVAMLVTGIALHNIPEGLAIGIGFVLDPGLGIMIALAIAVQDIPENVTTIIPLYTLLGKRRKSFAIIIVTILFELIGFLIGFFVLKEMSMGFLGTALGAAAGVMIFISIHELLPEAKLEENRFWKSLVILLGFAIVLVMALFFEFCH